MKLVAPHDCVVIDLSAKDQSVLEELMGLQLNLPSLSDSIGD